MADWLQADWPAPEGIVAGTTVRLGGVSAGAWRSMNLAARVGDEVSAVAENRRRFRERCALPGEPQWLQQVHASTVARLPTRELREPEADAAVTSSARVVCAVLTADCLPVAFACADGAALGIAHAGWRGLSAGVLESTVAALGAAPGSIMAWLGPAISAAAFEVGDEVRAAFLKHDAAAARCFERNAAGRWQADLYALARSRLQAAGVTQIFGGDRCTYREADTFFSYRRDGECGRMASFIYRL
jgi:YfiH family protein